MAKISQRSFASRPASLLLDELSRIAMTTSGRVGLAVVPLGAEWCDAPILTLNDVPERFPMASTFKVPLALSLLRRVDDEKVLLEQKVRLSLKDVRPGTGVLTKELLSAGDVAIQTEYSIRELLETALNDSDNTATDVLLSLVGGPAVVQEDLRSLQCDFMNVNRSCLEHLRDRCGVTEGMPAGDGKAMLEFVAKLEGLMEVLPLACLREADERFDQDDRDTTSPQEMTDLLRKIWYRQAGISECSTQVLLDIMANCRTGHGRIPGRLPEGVRTIHKTGSLGGRANDVGFVVLPVGAENAAQAIALSIYVKGHAGEGQTTTSEMYAERERVIADLARTCYDFFRFGLAEACLH